MPVAVLKNHCPQNHHCPSIRVCPTGALKQRGYDAPLVDAARCTDCGRCTRLCPTGAIRASSEDGPKNSRFR